MIPSNISGKKAIDINKISLDDLRKLGLNLDNMTKEEIATKIKEKFGKNVQVKKGGKTVGLKRIEDYGKEQNSDDLANDSDLDTSTLKGHKKVRVLIKRGGAELLEHMKNLITVANLSDEQGEEKSASINYVNLYRLVEPNKLDIYAKAFVVEDDDLDHVIQTRDARNALDAIPTVQNVTEKQVDYILKVNKA